jgi:hypothetical protein
MAAAARPHRIDVPENLLRLHRKISDIRRSLSDTDQTASEFGDRAGILWGWQPSSRAAGKIGECDTMSTAVVKVGRMATHDVSLNISRPIPVGNVDIEIPVRRNGRAFGRVKISKGSIDWMPANKSKTAYWLDWAEFARFMADNGRPV